MLPQNGVGERGAALAEQPSHHHRAAAHRQPRIASFRASRMLRERTTLTKAALPTVAVSFFSSSIGSMIIMAKHNIGK